MDTASSLWTNATMSSSEVVVMEIDVDSLFQVPRWMVAVVDFRKEIFQYYLEPAIVTLLGPLEGEESKKENIFHSLTLQHPDADEYALNHTHRRLGFLPSYVSNVKAFKETSMSFATLMMLFVTMFTIFLIFLLQ